MIALSADSVAVFGVVLVVLAGGLVAITYVLDYLKDQQAEAWAQVRRQQELTNETLGAMQAAVSATAKAVGEAVAASFPSPPALTKTSSGLPEWVDDPDIADGTVDDVDPTDSAQWLAGERQDGVSIGRVGGEVFGIPGLQAVRPPELDGK